jgi:hypothetical protein
LETRLTSENNPSSVNIEYDSETSESVLDESPSEEDYEFKNVVSSTITTLKY